MHLCRNSGNSWTTSISSIPTPAIPVAIDHGKGADALRRGWAREYIDFTSGIGVSAAWATATRPGRRAIYGPGAQAGAHLQPLLYRTRPPRRCWPPVCERPERHARRISGKTPAPRPTRACSSSPGSIPATATAPAAAPSSPCAIPSTGRTITTLPATGQDHFHEHLLSPSPTGYRYAPANDLAALEQAAGGDVCAVMMELVQGEGGVNPLQADYVRQVAALCRERDWLLLIDEVQTGIGRTGTLFALPADLGSTPDVVLVSFAKGIAGGLPFGGFLAGAKCRGRALPPGTHRLAPSARNPIAAAAANVVLDTLTPGISRPGAGRRVDYLREKAIEAMDSPYATGVRGHGHDAGRRRPPGHHHIPSWRAELTDEGACCALNGRQGHPAPAAPAGHYERRNGRRPGYHGPGHERSIICSSIF